ncbi:condensation domain-containing protein [Streptomyces sp. HC307]|uniref:condensation domain-containing protein n=1 Tax=Streptomyces flavusporus TaxID=3385496 RepID=UPI0039173AAA
MRRTLERDMPDTGDPVALSATQERLWVVDQLAPEGSYNVPLCFRLTGALDDAALHRAAQSVTRRHGALRTRFDDTMGVPSGRLTPPEDVRVDVKRAEADGRGRALDRLLYDAAIRPFDLSTGPLLRLQVVNLPGAVHMVLVVVHHGAFDGLSGPILTRELWHLYDAYASGKDPALPEPSAAYGDFARLQRDWLDSADAAEQLTYWTQRLLDPPAPLHVTAPDLRPAFPDELSRGVVEFDFSLEAVQATARACADLGATPFMVLLASFAASLARRTGAQDLIIGTPVTERPAKEFEAVIGPFDNTLLIRLDAEPAATAGQFVEQVSDVTVQALLHKDIPFQHVVRSAAPARGESAAPALCNVAFSVEERPLDPGAVHGAVVSADPWLFVPPARFDLTLMVELSEGCFTGRFYFDPERVGESALRALAEDLVAMPVLFAREPDSPLFPAGRQSRNASHEKKGSS